MPGICIGGGIKRVSVRVEEVNKIVNIVIENAKWKEVRRFGNIGEAPKYLLMRILCGAYRRVFILNNEHKRISVSPVIY